MSRRSQKIRAERREKLARKWATNEDAPTRDRRGVAKQSDLGVSLKPFPQALAGAEGDI